MQMEDIVGYVYEIMIDRHHLRVRHKNIRVEMVPKTMQRLQMDLLQKVVMNEIR